MSRLKLKAPKLSHRELLKIAREDVPTNSGEETFGTGKYCYTKMAMDGSSRIFRFRSHNQAMEAMEVGMNKPLPDYN